MALRRSTLNHWRHHDRFYLSVLLGLVVWLATWMLDPKLRLQLAGDSFFASYVFSMTWLAGKLNAAELRRRAAIEDEGIVLIVILTLAAIVFSLASLFRISGQSETPDALTLGLSIASVPLGWFMLHIVFAFRYAHIYYGKDDGEDAGGLEFPGEAEPCGWDFIYYAFVIGTAMQVSDVRIVTTRIRRTTWVHSVVAFFYNTVLIAVAVNLAMGGSG